MTYSLKVILLMSIFSSPITNASITPNHSYGIEEAGWVYLVSSPSSKEDELYIGNVKTNRKYDVIILTDINGKKCSLGIKDEESKSDSLLNFYCDGTKRIFNFSLLDKSSNRFNLSIDEKSLFSRPLSVQSVGRYAWLSKNVSKQSFALHWVDSRRWTVRNIINGENAKYSIVLSAFTPSEVEGGYGDKQDTHRAYFNTSKSKNPSISVANLTILLSKLSTR